MNNWSLLHLNAGFWLIGFPLIVIWICSYLYVKEKDKNCLNALEDFEPIEDPNELYRIEFKVSKEEKWKIGQVLKRAEYNNVDDLIRNSLYEIIK